MIARLYSVQQTVLEEGTGLSVFSRLKKSLTRTALNEPVPRIIQLDVANGNFNSTFEGALKESYKVEGQLEATTMHDYVLQTFLCQISAAQTSAPQ